MEYPLVFTIENIPSLGIKDNVATRVISNIAEDFKAELQS
jgi:hypothetical protein